MCKKILPLTLFILLPLLLAAYTVSIKGTVYGPGQVLSGPIKIWIRSVPEDPLKLDTIIVSNEDGSFQFSVEVSDSLEKGTLLISPAECPDNAHTQRVVFHPNHLQLEIRLRSCDKKEDCALRIEQKRSDSLNVQLIAHVQGTAPYKYLWNTGDTSAQIIVNLPGVYWVVVTTQDGCTARNIAHVKDPKGCETKIVVVPSQVSPSTGPAYRLVARSVGTQPLKYLWNTGDTTDLIHITRPGEYCVMVTDAAGCQSRDCVVIREHQCAVKIQPVRIQTNAADFVVQLIARAEGKAPFKYIWSTGDTSKVIRVLEPGEYCVTMTDAFGCSQRDCIKVDLNTECKTVVSLIPSNTAAESLFHLVARTAGRPPFVYLWSTGDTSKSIRVSELAEYCVKVTDANGCSSSACIDLSKIALDCSVEIKRIGHSHLLAVPRGFPPFRFLWSTGDTTRSIQPTTAGEYCITITNAYGCESKACILWQGGTFCQVKIQRKPMPQVGLMELIARVQSPASAAIKYFWSTGDTTQSIIVEEPGEYCVEISTGNCRSRDCVKIEPGLKPGGGVSPSDLIFSGFELQAYPNPTSDDLNMTLKTRQGGEWHVQVQGMDGKIVGSWTFTAVEGVNQEIISLASFQPGMYIVTTRSAESFKQIKIIRSE